MFCLSAVLNHLTVGFSKMSFTYVAYFLVILQVASSNHDVITTTENVPEDTTEFALDSNDTFTDFSTQPEGEAASDVSTVADIAQTTTLGPLNNSMTTTDDSTVEIVTYVYVTVTDDDSTTEAFTVTPKPIENTATVMSQPGIMILLPVLLRLLSLW